MKKHLLAAALFGAGLAAAAQDTFSIVAVDTLTGEVGSAGASCISKDNLEAFFPGIDADFLGDLLPGVAAINTQASYLEANQQAARDRIGAGDTPAEAIAWLKANDAAGSPGTRQYGIAKLAAGGAQSAAHTGANCLNHKGHRTGPGYSIQGNILLGPAVLDSMEARFTASTGCLAERLMAAMQGAKMPGADTRCASNGTSSMFAFVKVAQPGDAAAAPSLRLFVALNPVGIEPIDSLQTMFEAVPHCPASSAGGAVAGPAFSVEPNPSGGRPSLRFEGGGRLSVEVFDGLGRRVLSRPSVGSGEPLELAGRGVFLIKATDASGRWGSRRAVVE